MNQFKYPYSLVSQGGRATVTAFNPDLSEPVKQAGSEHPNFDAIVAGLDAGDPGVWELFDVAKGISARFEQVTDRVALKNGEVLWDGDPIHSTLAEQFARAVQDGNPDNYTALAKFWEKLESNPDEHSRTQAYDWLACHKFQITPEGDVVGYKGVYEEDGVFRSWGSSKVGGVPSGYVNGEPVAPLSVIPQRLGDIVTMPRSEVAHDPREACKRGLHVATRDYAAGYGNTILEVHVNPRDIVSVPTDGRGEKVRVCRYKVARLAGGTVSEAPVLRTETENVWAGDVGYKA